MANVPNDLYWRLRNIEAERMKENLRADAGYKGSLTKLYNEAQREIKRDISADIGSFATRESLDMAEARKRVSRTDIGDYKDLAAKYVKEKDFSPRANEEMALYNVTMRTNRLELLEAKIHLQTVALANQEEFMLQNHLAKEYLKELEYQSGILGFTIPSDERLNELMRAAREADFYGANFSERIWANQKEMQDELENVVRRTVLRGENPRVSARNLTDLVSDTVKNKTRAAQNLAITETARVMSEASKESYKRGGYPKYVFISEADEKVCKVCGGMHNQVYKVEDGQPGKNMEPMHVGCRCYTAAYAGRKELEERLNRIGG
jgi:SPP1 gp7 family putative phage head morphogenesis protein